MNLATKVQVESRISKIIKNMPEIFLQKVATLNKKINIKSLV